LPSRNRTTDDIFLIFNFPYFPSNQTNYIYQELASKLKNLGKKKKHTPVNVIWFLDPSLQKSSTLWPGMHHWRRSSCFPVQPEIYWTHYTPMLAVAALWKTLYPFIGN
jgi:hypothetical protein